MDDRIGVGELDRLFEQTRKALESLQASRSGGTAETAGNAQTANAAEAAGNTQSASTGEAAGGKVQAVVTGGRLESVTLDPRAMRMTSAELGEQIVIAVNAALEAQSAATELPKLPIDPAALLSQLRQTQDASLRQMEQFGQAMDAVVAQLRQAGR